MSIATVACALLTLIGIWVSRPRLKWPSTPIFPAALAWALALLASAWFAEDRAASLPRLGKALFPALVPLAVFQTGKQRTGRRAIALLLLSSAVASAFGLLWFFARGAHFATRARGAVGHYMTFAGQLMLLGSVALAVAAVARNPRWRLGALVATALAVAALAATFTRSSWLGFATSATIVLAGARPRWLPAFLALLVAIVVFAPGEYRDRLYSVVDPHHPMNVERTHMWEAGVRMFRDHPITGVGLQDLHRIYERYRSADAREGAGHLHSVPIHIAATMGILGLIAFAWLYGAMLWSGLAGLRESLRRGDVEAGVRLGVTAGLVGFLVAGLFEWNFGDEELLYLLYTLVGLAWSARTWMANGERR